MTMVQRYLVGQFLAVSYFTVCVIVGGYIFSVILMYFRSDINSLFYGQIFAVLLSFIPVGYVSASYISSVKPKIGKLASTTAAIVCALAWVSINWVEPSIILYIGIVVFGILFSLVGNQICTKKN